MLIASHPDYMMAYGACTYIEDSTQQWVTAQTNRLLRSFIKHQPDRRMLELQAHPLPFPTRWIAGLLPPFADMYPLPGDGRGLFTVEVRAWHCLS